MDNKKLKLCAFCEWTETKHELCKNCYELSQNKDIVKENNIWVATNKIGKEERFFDASKNYKLKKNRLSKHELAFYELAREKLDLKLYIVDPQVNMQAIIDTFSGTRNDELYRNIDFGIFTTSDYYPVLLIEINDYDHYSNPMKIERDKSVRAILKSANIPLLVIDNEDLEELPKAQIQDMLEKIVLHCSTNHSYACFTPRNYLSLVKNS